MIYQMLIYNLNLFYYLPSETIVRSKNILIIFSEAKTTWWFLLWALVSLVVSFSHLNICANQILGNRFDCFRLNSEYDAFMLVIVYLHSKYLCMSLSSKTFGQSKSQKHVALLPEDCLLCCFNYLSLRRHCFWLGPIRLRSISPRQICRSLNQQHDYQGILGFSCASGTGCSVVMLIVYGCYICFHWECIQKSTYRLLKNVEFQRDSLLKCGDDNESKTAICNRHFVLLELVISNIELYFKDSVQSVLLIYMYCISRNDLSSPILPNWRDIFFAVCSIVAHLKLFICFITKVLGLGSGEKMPDCGSYKWFLCVIGIIGCIIFEILSILYLALALSSWCFISFWERMHNLLPSQQLAWTQRCRERLFVV
jgi:hypothetical protein